MIDKNHILKFPPHLFTQLSCIKKSVCSSGDVLRFLSLQSLFKNKKYNLDNDLAIVYDPLYVYFIKKIKKPQLDSLIWERAINFLSFYFTSPQGLIPVGQGPKAKLTDHSWSQWLTRSCKLEWGWCVVNNTHGLWGP